MLGADALPTDIRGAEDQPEAGGALQAEPPLAVGRVPRLAGAARAAEFEVALDGDPDEVHAVGMLKVEVPPGPIEGGAVEDTPVDDAAHFVDGVGNLVFEVVPPEADPRGPGRRCPADPPADAGVELGNGEGQGIQVDGRIKRGRHVGRLDVVEGQVDAGGDEPQVGPAVFGPVIAPVHVPFGVALGAATYPMARSMARLPGWACRAVVASRSQGWYGRGDVEQKRDDGGTCGGESRVGGRGGDVGSMETQRQGLGRWGEEVALGHVVRRGWEVLARNWRIGRLEVDLIARDGPWLVIIEIKTRTEPVQADWHRMVSRAQQDRLIRAARAFLARHPERSLEVRFDVVAVLRNRYGHRILHTESAFYPLLPGR